SMWPCALLGVALLLVALHQLRAQTAPPVSPAPSAETAEDAQGPPPASHAKAPDQELQEAREQEKLRAADLDKAKKQLASAEKLHQEAQARLVKALEAKAQLLARDSEAVVKELETLRPRAAVPSYSAATGAGSDVPPSFVSPPTPPVAPR